MDIESRIAAALAAPKTHRVVTRYADGQQRIFDTRSLGSAELHAVGERRKVGRTLIERETVRRRVKVVSVTVEAMGLETLEAGALYTVAADGPPMGIGTGDELRALVSDGILPAEGLSFRSASQSRLARL